jgi:hypothetical protein
MHRDQTKQFLEKTLRIGDFVKIKQWDDMAEEFGYTRNKSVINVNAKFTEHMLVFCGKEYRIQDITGTPSSSYLKYKLFDKINDNQVDSFIFTTDMFVVAIDRDMLIGENYLYANTLAYVDIYPIADKKKLREVI